VSTIVAAAVEDGMGIVALANADTKADAIQDIVSKAAEKAFGCRNFLSPSSTPATSTFTRRSNQPLPRHHAGVAPRNSDIANLTGTYHNTGYGTGELCSVRSTSPSCKSVLDAFRSIDPSLSPTSTSTDLFASWATLFSTHIRFTPTTTNNSLYYLISAGSIYPQGHGKNTTAFSTLGPAATAEFVVENGKAVGFGWNNILDDTGVQRPGSVEETSEVWFANQANLDSSSTSDFQLQLTYIMVKITVYILRLIRSLRSALNLDGS
jgi:hypothetical protein